MFNNKWSWLLTALIIFFQSAVAQQYKIDFESENSASNWSGFTVVQINDSNHAALIESNNLYACNLFQPLEKSLHGKNLKFDIKANYLPDSVPSDAIFVVTLTRADSLVYYHGMRLDDKLLNKTGWNLAESSFLFPADFNQDLNIKSYIWNKSNSTFYVDNLQIDVEELQLPSFLPVVPHIGQSETSAFLFGNKYYKIAYNSLDQHLILADGDGNALTEPIQLLISSLHNDQSNNDFYPQWKYIDSKQNQNKTMLRFESKNANSITFLSLHCADEEQKIHIEIETKFRKKTTVERITLMVPFLEQTEQVFKKNALLDSCCFQAEYYLGHGGAKIGIGERGVLLINSLQLSSVQLQTHPAVLYLNTDLASDHPMIHYPLIEDTTDFFEDHSAIRYKKGAVIHGSLSLFVAATNQIIPRISNIPDGYDAAFIWTEHADWTDVRTHRAVNFGSENIESSSEATGGFVKYTIPVTKSIFFNNPDKVDNSQASNGLFPLQHASLKDDTAFASLIDQLKEAGHEICLHTPEQFTSTPKNLKNALREMQNTFGSPSWIDHGYNNKRSNNRENLVCDGNKKGAKLYAARWWKTFGVRYFWNPWWEEANPFQAYGFNGHFDLPYPGFGDAFPVAMIHKYPDIDNSYLWGTTGTLEAPNDALWNYYFQPIRLQALLNHRSVHITHVYPAWVKEGKGFWRFNENGQCVATDGLNQSLAAIDKLNKDHRLLPTTISYLVGYIEALENVHIEPLGNNRYMVSNSGINNIHGLSILAKATRVLINDDKKVQIRRNADDLIIWFDLAAGEEIILSFL